MRPVSSLRGGKATEWVGGEGEGRLRGRLAWGGGSPAGWLRGDSTEGSPWACGGLGLRGGQAQNSECHSTRTEMRGQEKKTDGWRSQAIKRTSKQ